MTDASKLLKRASECFTQGDAKYEEGARIIAQLRAEPYRLSYREIGERLTPTRSHTWVRRVESARSTDAPIDWESGSNKRDEVVGRALRDPEKRREAIASLDYDERMEVMREVSRSVPPVEPSPGREAEREVFQSVEDAPNRDLSALAARFVATVVRIDAELVEGAEFKRMDAKDLQRLDRDLDRAKDTIDRLKEQIVAQSKVRRVA